MKLGNKVADTKNSAKNRNRQMRYGLYDALLVLVPDPGKLARVGIEARTTFMPVMNNPWLCIIYGPNSIQGSGYGPDNVVALARALENAGFVDVPVNYAVDGREETLLEAARLVHPGARRFQVIKTNT